MRPNGISFNFDHMCCDFSYSNGEEIVTDSISLMEVTLQVQYGGKFTNSLSKDRQSRVEIEGT